MIEAAERDILTLEQAADYLQVEPGTIVRYIRDGKLLASRLGRSYRIPREQLTLLLWTMRARPDITLRDYDADAVAGFLRDDAMDDEARGIMRRFGSVMAADADDD